mmetsp:Transcript_8424/g.10654  ORF Transcript_8424/g.10654 Transcript_8424/m.10654 type:complete len:110 (-) Transcript_8424:2021-2350(-)
MLLQDGITASIIVSHRYSKDNASDATWETRAISMFIPGPKPGDAARTSHIRSMAECVRLACVSLEKEARWSSVAQYTLSDATYALADSSKHSKKDCTSGFTEPEPELSL